MVKQLFIQPHEKKTTWRGSVLEESAVSQSVAPFSRSRCQFTVCGGMRWWLQRNVHRRAVFRFLASKKKFRWTRMFVFIQKRLRTLYLPTNSFFYVNCRSTDGYQNHQIVVQQELLSRSFRGKERYEAEDVESVAKAQHFDFHTFIIHLTVPPTEWVTLTKTLYGGS